MDVCSMYIMAIPVMEFQVKKLKRFLSKNQHTQKKLLNSENWCNGVIFCVENWASF